MEAVEWSFIHKFSIPCFPMQAIDRVGIVNAVESALNMVDPLKVFTGVIKGTVSTVSIIKFQCPIHNGTIKSFV